MDAEREQLLQKWAMRCHASALAGFLFPFGNVLLPYWIWKKRIQPYYPELEGHAIAVLNFQLTMSLYALAGLVLLLLWVGIFVLIAIAVYELIVIFIATIEAHDLEIYDYPLSRKFIG
jgi:uncharacterized Tic20 family protein